MIGIHRGKQTPYTLAATFLLLRAFYVRVYGRSKIRIVFFSLNESPFFTGKTIFFSLLLFSNLCSSIKDVTLSAVAYQFGSTSFVRSLKSSNVELG